MSEPTQSPDLAALGEALAKAQGKIANAAKDRDNTFFHSKYADLAAVWEACRGPLTENGLSVTQQPLGDGERVGVRTTLLHKSGQFMASEMWGKPVKNDPQGAVSLVTYFRRCGVAAVAGVAPGDDDDGETASGRPPKPAKDYVNANKLPGKVEDNLATVGQQDRITDLALELGLDRALYLKDWIGPYMTAGGKKAESSAELTGAQAINLTAKMEAAVARRSATHAKMEAEAAANAAAIGGQMAQQGLKLPPKTKPAYKTPEEKKNGIPKPTPTEPELVKALGEQFETDEDAENWLTDLFSLDGMQVHVRDLSPEQRGTAMPMLEAFGTPRYDELLAIGKSTGRLARTQ